MIASRNLSLYDKFISKKGERFLRFSLTLILTIAGFVTTSAQDKAPVKFGKITPADFNLPRTAIDSNANAVVIADIGNTSFIGNNTGFFTLVFTRYMRVKILNKNGFDIGNREISLYYSDDANLEKIYSLKCSTYNLENGAVVESKLDDKSVFQEKYNSNHRLTKFAVPALREGSIFEIQYTIRSPFDFNLRDWSFQGEYPVLWSEYEVTIPSPYNYVMAWQGDQHFDVKTARVVPTTYSIRESAAEGTYASVETRAVSIASNDINMRWVKKNVPALHEEPFTTAISNYYSHVSFQLQSFQWGPEYQKHDYSSDWPAISGLLLKREDFGEVLNAENFWMNDLVSGITDNKGTETEKANKLYAYVRNEIKLNGYTGIYSKRSLKDIFKSKSGSNAEINLLLTSLMRKAGIKSDPLVLSTRANGMVHSGYPLIQEYNYLLCVVYLLDGPVALDASDPYTGFGQIPPECYNGWGHTISVGNPKEILFSADSVTESRLTKVILFNDEKGNPNGYFESLNGTNGSYDIRESVARTGIKKYGEKIQDQLGADLEVQNFAIDSLSQLNFPVTVHYDFALKNLNSADILYLNPVIGDGYKTNPFKSAERNYPIEIPYKINETYTLTMEIPPGYQVDEVPKSARVAYNDGEGFFEYLIQSGKENLQLRVQLKLNKTFFPSEDYTSLRDFFTMIAKKESEQIVLKKVK